MMLQAAAVSLALMASMSGLSQSGDSIWPRAGTDPKMMEIEKRHREMCFMGLLGENGRPHCSNDMGRIECGR